MESVTLDSVSKAYQNYKEEQGNGTVPSADANAIGNPRHQGLLERTAQIVTEGQKQGATEKVLVGKILETATTKELPKVEKVAGIASTILNWASDNTLLATSLTLAALWAALTLFRYFTKEPSEQDLLPNIYKGDKVNSFMFLDNKTYLTKLIETVEAELHKTEKLLNLQPLHMRNIESKLEIVKQKVHKVKGLLESLHNDKKLNQQFFAFRYASQNANLAKKLQIIESSHESTAIKTLIPKSCDHVLPPFLKV